MTNPPQKPTDDMREAINEVLVGYAKGYIMWKTGDRGLIPKGVIAPSEGVDAILALFATQTAQLKERVLKLTDIPYELAYAKGDEAMYVALVTLRAAIKEVFKELE